MVRVPATIITSDCRGLGLKIIPKRSRSYLGAPVCIISMAQQASPKVMGHMDPRRAQFMRASTFDIMYSPTLFMPTVAGGGAEPPYGAGDCDSYDGVVVWRKEDLWDARKEDLWDASKASLEAVLGTTRAAIILRKRERESL